MMTENLEANQYQCAICSGVFEKGVSDDEAVAELGESFPGIAPTDCDLVCGDCYHRIMGHTALATPDGEG